MAKAWVSTTNVGVLSKREDRGEEGRTINGLKGLSRMRRSANGASLSIEYGCIISARHASTRQTILARNQPDASGITELARGSFGVDDG